MNKKITLDFEANFSDFKTKMKQTFDEVQKTNEKFLGRDNVNSGSMSDSQRNRHERERLSQSKEKFLSEYNDKEKVGNFKNPFSQRAQDFYKQEKEFDKNDAALKENSEAIKKQNIDESIRYREYRSMSDKELKQRADELRIVAKKSLGEGDTDKAEAAVGELQSVQAAKKWKDKIGEKEGKEDENSQTKFMRQTARNLFLNDMMSSGTQILGHGTGMVGQVAHTGFQGYSAAQGAGFSSSGSWATGGALAAVSAIIKLFSSGEDMLKAQNKVGGVVDKDRVGTFGGMKEVGIGGPADREAMLERAKSLARETGYGGNLAKRTREQYMLQRGMGLESGDLHAFTNFEGTKGNNLGAGEGTLMFTKMLQHLDTGITLGDSSGAGKDLARLPKYLEKLLIVNERTFQVTGELSKSASKTNMAFLGGAIGLGGIFKNEKNASELTSGIQSSFANPGDDLMKFQNINAIRQTRGNLSPSEIIKLSENMTDTSVVNTRYKNLKNNYGNNRFTGQGEANFISDVQKQNGISSFTKAEQFVKEMDQNGGMASKKMLDKFIKPGGDSESILAKEAGKLTTGVEKLGSQLGNVITDLALAVRNLTTQIADFFGHKEPTTTAFQRGENSLKDGGAVNGNKTINDWQRWSDQAKKK